VNYTTEFINLIKQTTVIRGRVTRIADNLLYVATNQGLKIYPLVAGISVGDEVVYDGVTVTQISSKINDSNTYYR